MAFSFCRRAPRAKLPPVERAARKISVMRWVQIGVLALNVLLLGALAKYISSHDVAFSGGVIASIVMSSVAFVVTALGDGLGRYVGWHRRRWYLVLVIFTDMACIGTQIAAFVILTVAKLPAHCTGLTLILYRPNDPRNDPKPGYDTVGFGQPNERGELDGFCDAARVSWVISLLLLISYIHSIGWSIRLIVALKRHRKQQTELESQVNEDTTKPRQPTERTLPKYHLNIPILPSADASSDNVQPGPSTSVNAPTPAASPPPYPDEVTGVFVRDKKRRLGHGL